MKQNVPVSTIMTTNLIKLTISDDLTKAESLFKHHKIRHIPVVHGANNNWNVELHRFIAYFFCRCNR